MAYIKKCDKCGLTDGTIKLCPKTGTKYKLTFSNNAMEYQFNKVGTNEKLVLIMPMEIYPEDLLLAEMEMVDPLDFDPFEYQICNDCKKEILATLLFST